LKRSAPGDVGSFLKQSHYTFPVILAKSLVEDTDTETGIPRTWIIDSNGNIRLEQVGYNPNEWPQKILKKLTALKRE
jgi:hypothetical protein